MTVCRDTGGRSSKSSSAKKAKKPAEASSSSSGWWSKPAAKAPPTAAVSSSAQPGVPASAMPLLSSLPNGSTLVALEKGKTRPRVVAEALGLQRGAAFRYDSVR